MGHAYVMLIWLISVLAGMALWLSPVHAQMSASRSEGTSHVEWMVTLLFGAVRVHLPNPFGGKGSGPTRFAPLDAGAAVRHLLKGFGVHVDYFRIRAVLGFEDAALTAMACGVGHALMGGLVAWMAEFLRFSRFPEIVILPRYDRLTVEFTASCILRTSLGHLMSALAVGLWVQLRRRGVVAWLPLGTKRAGHIRSKV